MDKSRNPLGCIIMNQGWYGLNVGFVKRFLPSPWATNSALLWHRMPFNYRFNDYPLIRKADDLVGAVEMAKEITGNDMIIAYDGSYGYINCTRSAAEQLFANAPGIQKLVDEEMYPKYMAQRGYTIPRLHEVINIRP